jgi:hypothetical protein
MGDTNLVRARDGIDHAPLGDAYPEMMDRTGIMFTDGGIGGATGNYRDGLVTLDRRGDKDVLAGARGRYQGDLDTMTLDDGMVALDPAQAKSTTLHELQHAVQQREGFARGPVAKLRGFRVVEGQHSATSTQQVDGSRTCVKFDAMMKRLELRAAPA